MQARIGRRDAQRPPGLLLLAGILDVVVLRERLVRARERVRAGCGTGGRSGGGRAATRPTRAGRRRSTRPSPCRSPPAPASPCAQPPAATQKPGTSVSPSRKSRVGRERLGPVEEPLHLGALHRRHARGSRSQELLHAVPLLRQELRLEARRDAVERPRRGLALVAAHHEARRPRCGSRRGCPGRAASAAARAAGRTAR